MKHFKIPRVGRPHRIDKSALTEVLLKYKNEIVKEDCRIISKSDSIWIRIGTELNNIMTPIALYTFVACNKFGIRDKLCDRFQISVHCESDIRLDENIEVINENEDREQNSDKSKSISMSDITLSESNVCLSNVCLSVDGVLTFIVTIPKEDFISMIIYRRYRRREKNRPVSTRDLYQCCTTTWIMVACF